MGEGLPFLGHSLPFAGLSLPFAGLSLPFLDLPLPSGEWESLRQLDACREERRVERWAEYSRWIQRPFPLTLRILWPHCAFYGHSPDIIVAKCLTANTFVEKSKIRSWKCLKYVRGSFDSCTWGKFLAPWDAKL